MCPDKIWSFYYFEGGGGNIGGKLAFSATNIVIFVSNTVISSFQSEIQEVLKRVGLAGGKGW